MSMLSDIATALKLPEEGQDWGIEHSDPRRLEEFVAFAETYRPKNPWESEALAELVMQSSEEALELGILGSALQHRIIAFVEAHGHSFPVTLEYWRSLPPQEWHVTKLLQGTQSGA
jgi:hypothetical protein